MHEIRCGEIWGGIRGDDLDVVTSGVQASLFASASGSDQGGDIYYFSVCDSDLLTRVAVADVAGHGASVTQTSQWLYESLRSRMNAADGSGVLEELNLLAVKHGLEAMTTAAVAAFYRANGELTFSYAGHHPLLLRRNASSEWLELSGRPGEQLSNLPLGVAESVTYEDNHVPVAPGSQLILYTDGVVEVRNASGEFFGIQGLRKALDGMGMADARTLKRKIMSRVRQHAGDTLDHDDVTLIVVEVK